jgi:tetratricopeptide (TPR) repeat protein
MRETLFVDIKDLALVNILTYFGLIYINMHKYDDALKYHMRAFKVAEDIFPIGHSNISDCLTNIGNAYRGMNDYTKAFEYYEKATKNEEENSVKPDLIRLARNYDNMGICLFNQGNEETGLEYRMKSVRIIEKVHPRIHYANVVDSIGDIFSVKEMYDNALECYLISLNIKLQCLSSDDVSIAETLINIGDVYIEQEENQQWQSDEQYHIKARHYFEQALDIYITNKDINSIRTLNRIGSIYENIHKYHLALDYYGQAMEISEKYFPFDESFKKTNNDNITRVKQLLK